MDNARLRAKADELMGVPWMHSIQLFPDLTIKGAKAPTTLLREKAAVLEIIDLNDKYVIDVGAWNGYFSFEAKRAGASRVIATDSFVWKHPLFRGRETFELARECVGLDIEVLEIDPTEMPGDLQPADVVLFLGVFYHLFDPIMVLRKITPLARDVLIVETMQDLLDRKEPGMIFYPEADRPKGTTRWWGPNPACVYELLLAMGFARILYQDYPTGTRARGIYHAFRSNAVEAAYLRRSVDNRKLFDLGSHEAREAVFGRSGPADARPPVRERVDSPGSPSL